MRGEDVCLMTDLKSLPKYNTFDTINLESSKLQNIIIDSSHEFFVTQKLQFNI